MTPQLNDDSLPRPSPKRIYSVPRRYDLATLFVVTLAYALLFAVLRAFQAPPHLAVITGSFVTLVGLGQAILFGGSKPRAASMLVGAVTYGLWLLIVGVIREVAILEIRDVMQMLFFLACTAPWVALGGAILGYVAGVAVGAVFLIADCVRRGARRFRGRL